MTMTVVVSSVIDAFSYDEKRRALRVRFCRTGAMYEYSDVPPVVHAQMRAAESKGQFFTRNIRPNYPFEIVSAA